MIKELGEDLQGRHLPLTKIYFVSTSPTVQSTNLDPMDLKSNHTAPVLTDPVPLSKSRLRVHSTLFPYSPPGAAFSPELFLTVPRKKTGVLDDVRSSSWLDAMKASSPPHRKITKAFNNELPSSDADIAYRDWMVLSMSAFVIFYWILHWFLYLTLYELLIDPLITALILQFNYPSALKSFEQITNFAKGKRIALFLDYDGTLSPIVDNPDCAFMSDAVSLSLRL